MFCGSCMQDNDLSRELIRQGCEVSLIPTYTPIRVDQENVASSRVFLGGINLYLDNTLPGWRYLPRWLVSWLDHPSIIRMATARGIENDAAKLGSMTLAMLAGSAGAMQREYRELVHYLVHLKPDLILFTNALLSGVLPDLRKQYTGPIACLLQGDDLFLESLSPCYRQLAREKITSHARLFDRFITHSRFYARHIGAYLNLPSEKFSLLPLSIAPFAESAGIAPAQSSPAAEPRGDQRPVPPTLPYRIGYFARIAPEKGLLELVRATRLLHEAGLPVELHAGGYLGKSCLAYMHAVEREAVALDGRFHYAGSPRDASEKYAFLRRLDVFSVPVTYPEPKGLYVLEALSAGVPVVLPRRGSLPELVESTQGGLLFQPGDPSDHARALRQLLENPEEHRKCADLGRAAVARYHSTHHAAEVFTDICRELVESASRQGNLPNSP